MSSFGPLPKWSLCLTGSRLEQNVATRWVSGLCAMFVSMTFSGALVAAEADVEVDVEAAEALRSMPATPWYDRESGSYAPPRVPGDGDNAIRRDGWLKKGDSSSAGSDNSNQGGGTYRGPAWGFGAGVFSSWFSTAVISLLGIMLIAVLMLLTYHSLRNYLPTHFSEARPMKAIEIDPARVVDLPFEVAPTNNDPLSEAERLMRAGQLDAATVFLYGYMLLVLDHARKIHLQKGKTNRMYLRELGSDRRLRGMLENTMLAFEDVFFGKHSITHERFMQQWNQIDEFQRLITASIAPGPPGRTPEVATA